MPKPLNEDAETILSGKQKNSNISTTNASAKVGKTTPIVPMYPEWKAPGLDAYSQWYENGAPNLVNKLDPNSVYQGGYVPLPKVTDMGTGDRPAPKATLPIPAGTGMNLRPEDYQNLAGKSALDILAMYMPRAEIDSRFPMGVTEEEAMNYLMDNYSWLFPERTATMGGEDTTGGGGGGGGMGDIPLPDLSWGGGGYGQKDYLRDSGLINWRI